MIKVILVDDDVKHLGALQKILSEHFKQVDIKNLFKNFRLPNESQRVALPDSDGMHFFEANRIICCSADNSYTYFNIKTNDPRMPVRRLAISKGLSHWEDFLYDKGFFYRVHNRYLVNINYIKKYVRNDSGYLVMDDNSDTVIPVARARKDDFLQFLKSKGIII